MFRSLVLSVLLLGVVSWQVPSSVAGESKYPHMHHALRELREARTQLKEANHDFGGHKVKAIEGVDAAIKKIDESLKGAGDNTKGTGKVDPGIYKKYVNHPHIHHAIHELKEARIELKEAKHDFGGHRAAAIRDINYAIEQLELCLKFAPK